MDFDSKFNRRDVMKWGFISTSAPILAASSSALGQNLGPGNAFVGDETGRDAEKLYTGHPVVGGGQMEIRLNQSIYTDDPHALQVAQRLAVAPTVEVVVTITPHQRVDAMRAGITITVFIKFIRQISS